MALTKKAHTVRLLNFEEELLTQLSKQKEQSEEQLLLTYIRAGLKREKLEGLESYGQREKKAVKALYTERVETLYRPPTKTKKEKQVLQQVEDNAEGDLDESISAPKVQAGELNSPLLVNGIEIASSPIFKNNQLTLTAPETETSEPSTLDQQFFELATLFELATPDSEQVIPGQRYLLKGQKELRIVVIKQIQPNGAVQFQIGNKDSDKPHNFAFKRFAEVARGAIAEAQVEALQARLQE